MNNVAPRRWFFIQLERLFWGSSFKFISLGIYYFHVVRRMLSFFGDILEMEKRFSVSCLTIESVFVFYKDSWFDVFMVFFRTLNLDRKGWFGLNSEPIALATVILKHLCWVQESWLALRRCKSALRWGRSVCVGRCLDLGAAIQATRQNCSSPSKVKHARLASFLASCTAPSLVRLLRLQVIFKFLFVQECLWIEILVKHVDSGIHQTELLIEWVFWDVFKCLQLVVGVLLQSWLF